MIYPNNFESKIGFDKIRELISSKCLSSLGEERVEQLLFNNKFTEINEALYQTDEFMQILQEDIDFPVSYFIDVRSALSRIRIAGTWMDEAALFDLRRSLQTIQDIVRFFNTEEEENAPYPYLHRLSKDVAIFPKLIKDIDQILDSYGRIKDNASPELNKIRREKAQVAGTISKTLNSILRAAQSEGIVDQDVKPSIRDGRLVIPVAPAHKRKIRGIVHDESATGKTVFIEPAQVVEANNRVRELENDERREIIKILTSITDIIRPIAPEISESYNFLGSVDFIRAKAVFALEIEAIKPAIEDTQIVDWVEARHPLLYLSHKKSNKTIVPLDIKLDLQNRILIISGPNAGGKSVCLKTVGLLQYMVQCGIPIPLLENSKVGVFEHIFIDIGDEQSIEDDLSTYSSHLTNMKFFVRNCTEKTIILIDEFGGGTEPQIGGAIAEALLKRFNEKKTFGIITTHYQNLKHFANENDGVINGAMLYDRHLMQPLYTLSIGNPGSSFAIEIARKIGLPDEVIQDASDIVGSDYVNMDKYLQDIVRDKRYWETKRQNIRKKEKQLEELTSSYESNLLDVEKERKKIIREAKTEAEHLLNEANAKIENTIRTIKESQAEKERTKDVRQALNEFKESLKDRDAETNHKITKKIEKLQSKKTKKRTNSTTSTSEDKKEITIGDLVKVKGQSTIGEVIDIQRNNAIVAFGMIKTTAKLDSLEYVSKNQAKREVKTSVINSATSDEMREKKLNFKQDIDIRGMRGEEALQAVMYFVDDAILVGMNRIRILHGTGTGALRSMIRDYLRTVPNVTHFADEHVQFGGAGITVIDLA